MLRRVGLRIGDLPRFRDTVELETFCSGTGATVGRASHHCARRRGPCGVEAVALWVYVDASGRARTTRGLVLRSLRHGRERPARSAAGSASRRRPSDAVRRDWVLRQTDLDVLGHVNNAIAWAAVEDELARDGALGDARIAAPRWSTGHAIDEGDPCELVSPQRRADGMACWLVDRRRRQGGGADRTRPRCSTEAGRGRGTPGVGSWRLQPLPPGAFAGRRVVVTGGLGFIGSNLALDALAAGAEVTVVDARHAAPRREPAQPRAWRGTEERRVRGHGGRGRPRRADARRGRGGGRDRVQPRGTGQPRRLDDRPALRPRRQHPQPRRAARGAPSRQPERRRRVHVDPPALRQAAVPAGRRGASGRCRSTSTASRSTPPSSSTCCTTSCYGLASNVVRLTNVYGPRQRLRDDYQGFLPIFVRRALLDEAIQVFGDG